MQQPTQLDPFSIDEDIVALPAFFPIPGLGLLPMNSTLIRGEQPMLVDTGPQVLAGALLERLATLIDLGDLRWIWMTHGDPDHTGALLALLEAAPKARVVTTFLGAAKLALSGLLPDGRAYLVNPGQRLDIGDREILALRPPVYDAPETTAAFDPRTSTLFSADCFGALLEDPEIEAQAIEAAALRRGMLTWASVDAPWLENTEPEAFGATLGEIRRLAPRHVLSAHLPAARELIEPLTDNLLAARGNPGFVGPDQAAIEAMMQT